MYVNSDSFELITNFVGSHKGIVRKHLIQYFNYDTMKGHGFFIRTPYMLKISIMPKIIAFLLLNKINIDPRRAEISVNHMQWMLDNGFLISKGIRTQILQTFDLPKLKFLLSTPQNFQTKQATVSVRISPGILHEDELRILYMGPTDGKTILSEKNHRDFLTYLYSETNLPFDFFAHEGYIDFSYDIIYSMHPQKFDGFVQNLHDKNISVLQLVKWAVLHKLKISPSDVSIFYHQSKETFTYLINTGYLPEKETIYEIVLSEDFTFLDILKKNGSDFSFGNKYIPPRSKAWLAKNNR